MNSNRVKIVMLCGNGLSSRIMYHSLNEHVDIACVIIENKPSTKLIIQRRIKNIGLLKTLGQVAFMIISKLVAKASVTKMNQLISTYQLNTSEIPSNITKKVETINCDETIRLLQEIKPTAIVVNGTRIISKNVLSAINVPFINTHMGITPKYRGVHGGYWALANNDMANCGVTVHLVDQGIDTGGVLYQDVIYPSHNDNFNTYPIHQIAIAIPLMKMALKDIQENNIHIKKNNLPSYLWYHPTLFEYLKNWLINGVK